MMRSAVSQPESIDPAAIMAPAAQVEAYLADFIAERQLPENLREAIVYSALSGGKRLRPALIIRACEAVGGDASAAMAPAGAMELIHCFSLVHDDLPAMDDDDLRRGRPTLHKHTNEAMAILAGDAMTGLAFELIATRLPDADLAGRITLELARATNDMIAGQVYDTLPDFADDVSDVERLKTIHRNKTGALIRGSCRIGAICGGADDAQLASLTAYGETMGLMFQVVDDLLDVTQTTEHLGKGAGKDAEMGKMTYPGLLGVDGSRMEVERLRGLAIDALQCFPDKAQPLRDLCEFFATRTR